MSSLHSRHGGERRKGDHRQQAGLQVQQRQGRGGDG